MFDGRPGGHIKADFRDKGLSGDFTDTINLGQVDAGGEVEGATEVKGGRVFFAGWAAGFRKGLTVEVNLRLELLEGELEVLVKFVNLLSEGIIEKEGLFEEEELCGQV